MADSTNPQKGGHVLKFHVPNLTDLMSRPLPPIGPSPIIQNLQDNCASEFYKRLLKWINDFDAGLDQTQEVGVRLVTFGQAVTFHLENISYSDPSLISFKGHTEKGQPVELIQHVSQISILLTSLPRENPNKPKKPIGFYAQNG